MVPRFKVGDVIAVHRGSELVMYHGWNDTMVLKIRAIVADAYTFEHLTDASRNWLSGSISIWECKIIDNNFEIDKTGTILYGKI